MSRPSSSSSASSRPTGSDYGVAGGTAYGALRSHASNPVNNHSNPESSTPVDNRSIRSIRAGLLGTSIGSSSFDQPQSNGTSSPSTSSPNPNSSSTTSTSSSSRDFLIPIGATGARQKLSIVNAGSQRRRPPTADQIRKTSSSSWSNVGNTNSAGATTVGGTNGIKTGGSLHRQQQEQKKAASNLISASSGSAPTTPTYAHQSRSSIGTNQGVAPPAFGSTSSNSSPTNVRSFGNQNPIVGSPRDFVYQEDDSSRNASIKKADQQSFGSRTQDRGTIEALSRKNEPDPDPRFAAPLGGKGPEEEASSRERNRPYSLNIGSNRSLSSSGGGLSASTSSDQETTSTSPRWSTPAFDSANRSSSSITTSALTKRPSTSPYGNTQGASSSSSLIRAQAPPHSRKQSMESLRGLARFGSKSRKNSMSNGNDSDTGGTGSGSKFSGYPPSSSSNTPTQEKSNPLWSGFGKKETSSTSSLVRPGLGSRTSQSNDFSSPSRKGMGSRGESTSSLNANSSPSSNFQHSSSNPPYTDPIQQDSRFPNPQFSPATDRVVSGSSKQSPSGSRPGSSSGARAAASLRATKAGFKSMFGKKEKDPSKPQSPQGSIDPYTHGIPISNNKPSRQQSGTYGSLGRDQGSYQVGGDSDFGPGQSYQSQNGTFGSQNSGLGLGASYSSTNSGRNQTGDFSIPPMQFDEKKRQSRASEASSYASSASFSYRERSSSQGGPSRSHLDAGDGFGGDKDVAPTIDFDLPSPGFSFGSSPLGGEEVPSEADNSASSSPSKSRNRSGEPSSAEDQGGKDRLAKGSDDSEKDRSVDSPYTRKLLMDLDMAEFSNLYRGDTSLEDALAGAQGEDEIKLILKKKLQEEKEAGERQSAAARDALAPRAQRDSMDSDELKQIRENHARWSSLQSGSEAGTTETHRMDKSLPPTPSTSSPITPIAGAVAPVTPQSASALGLEPGSLLSPTSASSFQSSFGDSVSSSSLSPSSPAAGFRTSSPYTPTHDDRSNPNVGNYRDSASTGGGAAERMEESSTSSHAGDSSGPGSRGGTPQPSNEGSYYNNPDSISTPPSTSTSTASLTKENRTGTPDSKGSIEVARPSIPVKSKERSIIQPDPATLARLENGTPLPPSSSPIPALFQLPNTESENGDSVTDNASNSLKSPTSPSPASAISKAKKDLPAGVDPATYVPPGALSRTRKGTALNTPIDASSSPASKQASLKGRDRSASAASEKASRGIQSRFSMASTDASSVLSPVNGDNWDEGSSPSSQSLSLEEESDPMNSAASDGQMLPASAWVEVEAALRRFKDSTPGVDKGSLLRTVVLPFLALEAETPNVEVSGSGIFRSSKSRRNLFFDWIRNLLLELQHVQTSADRGAILESIACIIESRNFSNKILKGDEEDLAKFNSVFGHILSYAIGELNKKGVYQNTLIFSGRLLAVAFFRVEGVASKLLRALPVNRFALERVANEAAWDSRQPTDFDSYRSRFPTSLQDFCFQDARTYLQMLDSQTLSSDGVESDDDRYLVRQDSIEVEMTGNWLRRWQSDDSELFFSFCRSYHRQLASLLASEIKLKKVSKMFFGGPGYAHLATCIHQKCLSLVHRDILSVTTLSSQKNFNPGETANVLSGSTAGKPRHLEAANRRCTAIVVDIVRAPNVGNHMFGAMLGVYVKCLVKRTSLYDVQGVFCLLDWMDGVLSHMESAELNVEKLIDIDFVITSISLLLENADHALALMRTIAFCYTNFAVLVSTKANRTRFCEEILLKPAIFQKLFLSWSFTIRAYFLHLLVFRLARINDFANPKDDPMGKTSVNVARSFGQRLDEIRKRHDELSPSPSSTDAGSSEEDADDFARFKKRPQSFVSTIRHTPSIHRPESASVTKAERVLGIGMPDPVLAPKGEQKVQSRAAKWLRALGGKGSKGKAYGGGTVGSGAAASPFASMDSPLISNEPRRRKMIPLDELDLDDLDSDSDASDEGDSGFQSGSSKFDTSESRSNVNDPSLDSAKPVDTEPIEANHGDNIAMDASFDLQSPTSPFPPSASGVTAGRSSAASPRVSKAFSKRSSILPGPAYDLVGDDEPPVPAIPAHLRHGYDKSLHIYAIQSLREYEQTVQEHDEFFQSQANPDVPAVPRLGVHWPQMWSE